MGRLSCRIFLFLEGDYNTHFCCAVAERYWDAVHCKLRLKAITSSAPVELLSTTEWVLFWVLWQHLFFTLCDALHAGSGSIFFRAGSWNNNNNNKKQI